MMARGRGRESRAQFVNFSRNRSGIALEFVFLRESPRSTPRHCVFSFSKNPPFLFFFRLSFASPFLFFPETSPEVSAE